MSKWIRMVLIVFVSLVLTGCGQHYVTPGGGVSLAAIAAVEDEDIAAFYAREPASPLPANIAVIRVQDSGYRSYTAHGYGIGGRFTIVTTRDIETDEAFGSIRNLAKVADVAPVGRLLVPANANNIRDLRTAAARLRADMLLVYTVDTTFDIEGTSLGPLSAVSLGFISKRKANVTATIAGALFDVRTGFVYGTTEATAQESQRATVWSTQLAIDSSRVRAEKKAFDEFVSEFVNLWPGVVQTASEAKHNASPVAADAPAAASYYNIVFE